MDSKVKFNAREALADFDPYKGIPMKSALNGLKVGETYEIFEDKDPKEISYGDKKFRTVVTGEGIKCLPPILASMLIKEQKVEIYPNKELDKKFHCIIPARDKESSGKEYDVLANHYTKEGHFPKFKVVAKLPTAIAKESLHKISVEPKIEAHKKHHGEDPTTTEMEWLPHCDLIRGPHMKYRVGEVTHLWQFVVELV